MAIYIKEIFVSIRFLPKDRNLQWNEENWDEIFEQTILG